MKKLLFFLPVMFFGSINIKGQSPFPNTDSLINYLDGGWTQYRSCGGFAGGCYYPNNWGFFVDIRFAKINGVHDSITYKTYKNGSLNNSGTTKISSYGSGPSSTWRLENINYSTSHPGNLILFFSQADSVLFSDGMMDGFYYTYSRNHTVGINEQEKINDISIYPNPVSEKLFLSRSGNYEIENVLIHDVFGKKIKSEVFNPNGLDVSELNPGIYFVQVQTPKGRLTTKIVKE